MRELYTIDKVFIQFFFLYVIYEFFVERNYSELKFKKCRYFKRIIFLVDEREIGWQNFELSKFVWIMLSAP
jgi:hypothetical protein